MKKADYSIASDEEREDVILILQRNANQIIENKKVKDSEKLRKEVDRLSARVRQGDIITGQDFEKLIQLFQKKSIVWGT